MTDLGAPANTPRALPVTDRFPVRVGDATLNFPVFRPVGPGPFSAILLLPAIAGVNDYVLRTAARLADRGYLTVVVDYFAREGKAPDVSTPEKIGAAVAALDDRAVLADIGAALAALRADATVSDGQIATFGFCIGGMYAFLAGCEHAGLAAVVDYYGSIAYAATGPAKPVSPLDRAGDLTAPILAHFGDFDRLISISEIDAFGAALRAGQKHHEICVYRGAPHAFDEDFRPQVFRPVTARAAWRSSLAFLDWHLRGIQPR